MKRRTTDPLEVDYSDDNFSSDDVSLHSKTEEGKRSTKKSIKQSAKNSTKKSNTSDDAAEITNLLRKDNRIRMLRAAALLILIVAAFLVSFLVYNTLRATEQHEFETRFWDQSAQVGSALRKEMQSKLQVIDSLSVTTSSYANSRGRTWPNITIPEFSYRAAGALTIARGISMALQPVITSDLMEAWEAYSSKEQSWITTDIAFQKQYISARESQADGGVRRRTQKETNPPKLSGNAYNVSEFVFHVEDGVPKKSQKDVTLPFWQHTPVLEGLPWINYDVSAKEENKGPISEVLNNQQASLGMIYELSDSILGYNLDPIDYEYTQAEWTDIWGLSQNHFQHDQAIPEDKIQYDEEMMDNSASTATTEATMYSTLEGPAVNIWYPVFSDLSGTRDVTAILSMTAKWESFLLPNLPPDPNGLVVVIRNECDQVITFDITGTDVTYLGPRDLHEPEYDELKQTYALDTDISTFSMIQLSTGFCPYSATVYPSNQMREEFESMNPAAYTAAVATIFVFAIAVFVLYDFLVERRQNFLADTAHKSSVIVSGLFPSTVRDRLYEEKKGSPTTKSGQFLASNHRSMISNPSTTAPIADVYTSTTIMFGDIAGFTAWSSTREPSEVFVLLETLYAACDKIAKRMNVFKVETIGDCYMAVTGLPNPQEEHHLIMVKFARQLLEKTSLLTKELESTLGPDTGNLRFRIGLHSGPVTAGVLRGEKSRFQLFGDTVNTASRMESNGQPNRIHISQATADLIAASGKAHWLKKRDELVEAKGKGKVQTYWVKTKKVSKSVTSIDETSRTDDPSSSFWGSHRSSTPIEENGIRKSLVNWQVDILSKLLKQISCHRQSKLFRLKSKRNLSGIDDGLSLRDAISESIKMPDVDPKRAVNNAPDFESVVIPEPVIAQLEAFLWSIAQMYQENNGFHNYEHACHVTMSCNKYLHRIVAAAVDTDGETEGTDELIHSLASDPLAHFATIFSALVHDVGHPGVSNQQLASEGSDLAVAYGNKSILEQNSIQAALATLNSGSYPDLLSFLFSNDHDYSRFRQLVINCVMATDIFDNELSVSQNQRWMKAFGDESGASATIDLKATLVLEHVVQAADVAHTMQHWHVYQKWNQCLFDEICDAYHKGRSSGGDPADGWYKGELWFFDNYVIPLAKKLAECRAFGGCSDECLTYALQNRQEWEINGEQIVEKMKADRLSIFKF